MDDRLGPLKRSAAPDRQPPGKLAPGERELAAPTSLGGNGGTGAHQDVGQPHAGGGEGAAGGLAGLADLLASRLALVRASEQFFLRRRGDGIEVAARLTQQPLSHRHPSRLGCSAHRCTRLLALVDPLDFVQRVGLPQHHGAALQHLRVHVVQVGAADHRHRVRLPAGGQGRRLAPAADVLHRLGHLPAGDAWAAVQAARQQVLPQVLVLGVDVLVEGRRGHGRFFGGRQALPFRLTGLGQPVEHVLPRPLLHPGGSRPGVGVAQGHEPSDVRDPPQRRLGHALGVRPLQGGADALGQDRVQHRPLAVLPFPVLGGRQLPEPLDGLGLHWLRPSSDGAPQPVVGGGLVEALGGLHFPAGEQLLHRGGVGGAFRDAGHVVGQPLDDPHGVIKGDAHGQRPLSETVYRSLVLGGAGGGHQQLGSRLLAELILALLLPPGLGLEALLLHPVAGADEDVREHRAGGGPVLRRPNVHAPQDPHQLLEAGDLRAVGVLEHLPLEVCTDNAQHQLQRLLGDPGGLTSQTCFPVDAVQHLLGFHLDPAVEQRISQGRRPLDKLAGGGELGPADPALLPGGADGLQDLHLRHPATGALQELGVVLGLLGGNPVPGLGDLRVHIVLEARAALVKAEALQDLLGGLHLDPSQPGVARLPGLGAGGLVVGVEDVGLDLIGRQPRLLVVAPRLPEGVHPIHQSGGLRVNPLQPAGLGRIGRATLQALLVRQDLRPDRVVPALLVFALGVHLAAGHGGLGQRIVERPQGVSELGPLVEALHVAAAALPDGVELGHVGAEHLQPGQPLRLLEGPGPDEGVHPLGHGDDRTAGELSHLSLLRTGWTSRCWPCRGTGSRRPW